MEFKCEHCDKIYKSYQSRWNHMNKIHNTHVSQKLANVSHDVSQKLANVSQRTGSTQEDDGYSCKYCDKNYKHRSSKSKHEKKCNRSSKNNQLNDIINVMKKQNDELKEMLQKALKIHPRTLQKINKQLINNGTIQNNTINIVPLGSENLNQIFTDKEKLAILNKKYNSINELINRVHILPDNRYNQFKNVYITNLQNDIAYEYNNTIKQFQAVDKNELLEKLIDKRMIDIETFALELDEKNNLPPELSELIDKFTEQMWSENSELKLKKIKQVKLLLYNNRDTIKENLNKEYNILEL